MDRLTRILQYILTYIRRALIRRQSHSTGEDETVLLLCRRESDLETISMLPSGATLVVAADDEHTRQTASELASVSELVYFEELTTAVEVSDEVIEMREHVNEWLSTLHAGDTRQSDSDSLFWRCVPEGAYVQRLLDAVLVTEFVQTLIATHDPDRVVLPQSMATRFDDRVIRETVEEAGVPLTTMNTLPAELLRLAGEDPSSYYYVRHERAPIPVMFLWTARSIQLFDQIIRPDIEHSRRGLMSACQRSTPRSELSFNSIAGVSANTSRTRLPYF